MNWSAISADPLGATANMNMDEFISLLKEAALRYYDGAPVISDEIFDLLRAELQRIAPDHPYFTTVGAPMPALAHNKVRLPYHMGSLDKIRDDPEAITKFVTKFGGPSYIVSDKLDGNSAMLFVNKKKEYELYSRGDGKEGQILNHVLPFLQTRLPNPNTLPQGFAVRGELLMQKTDWERLQHKGANMRNVVAGALHAIKSCDPEIAEQIHFVAYEQIHPEPASLADGLEHLSARGFEIVRYQTLAPDAVSAEALSEILMTRRKKGLYEIDGIVVTHNGAHKRPTSGNPKFAFAFKTMLTHDKAEVTVTRVEWNVSKDKYLKPIIRFHPVTLAGAQIQKATGFHARFIEDNKIGPGARLVIVRSGDVIPHVHQVLAPAPTLAPQMPSEEYIWNASRTDIMAIDSSPELDIKRIAHFAASMKIRGLAEKTVAKLYEGGIHTIAGLLAAPLKTLQQILSAKIGQNIHEELSRIQKEATLVDYAVASNLFGRGFSHKRLELIFGHPKRPFTLQDLKKIEGIGATISAQFMEALPAFEAFLKRIPNPPSLAAPRPAASPLAPAPAPTAASPLYNAVVVFTGFRDAALEARVVALGGRVASTVSGATTHLVAKDCTVSSGKIEKAMKNGTICMSREEFMALLSQT